MLSSHDDNGFAVVSFFVDWEMNIETNDRPLRKCLPNLYLGHNLFIFLLLFNEISLQLSEGVGVRVSNIELILMIISFEFEGQPIVHTIAVLTRQFTSLIIDLHTRPPPPLLNIIHLLVLSHRVYYWLHAIVEQGITFSKINNRKCVLSILFHSLN